VSGNIRMMANSIRSLDQQDLPEVGACPTCHSEARFREIDPSTERYRIDCRVCGVRYAYLDSLEDLVD
jgi:transcription elongation factor Elf1